MILTGTVVLVLTLTIGRWKRPNEPLRDGMRVASAIQGTDRTRNEPTIGGHRIKRRAIRKNEGKGERRNAKQATIFYASLSINFFSSLRRKPLLSDDGQGNEGSGLKKGSKRRRGAVHETEQGEVADEERT